MLKYGESACIRLRGNNAIDRGRVKEMSEKREDPFFSPTIFSSIGYVFTQNYLVGSKFTKFDVIFHIFHILLSYFSILFLLITF
jgi:hypothetical protein